MKTIILILLISINILPAGTDRFEMLQSNLISGLIPDIEDGYGVALRDFNADGYADVYLVCFRNMNRLLVNNGGIVPFIDRTVYSGLGGDLSSRGKSNLELGAGCADFDNDGLPDMFLAGWGKTLKLFRNQGQFRFQDVTEILQMQGLTDANQGLWLDANNDGFLDLYITDEHHSNRLFLNNKKGMFREALWAEGFTDSATSQGAISADFDNDGDADIYVANWHHPDYLLINDGSGIFKQADLSLPTLIINTSSNSAVSGDIDNDGYSDLIVSGHNGYIYFYRNQSVEDTLFFKSDTTQPFFNIGHSVYGALLEDFNQDGWLDIFLAVRSARNRLYLNDGTGGFESVYDSDGQKGYSTGCAAGDIDGDGDLDIFVANKNILSQIYLNPINNNRFIKLKLTGVVSNRDAVGSKVYLYTGQDSLRRLVGFREVTVNAGYLSSKSPELYFGTGTYQKFEVQVVFPSGREITRKNLIPGESYQIYEYGTLLRYGYILLHRLQFHITHLNSWLNFFLFFFLVGLIYLYVKFGLHRYKWQALEIATQLIIWFIITLISFIAVRGQDALIILASLNATSFTAVFISVLYSEQQLKLRRRRARFRSRVQSLSARMINIHENELLYRDVKETVLDHDDIERVVILVYSPETKILQNYFKPDQQFTLTENDDSRLQENDIEYIAATEKFQHLLNSLKINILLPVKREGELFALIAINMRKYQSAVNQEDLHLLLPLANQVAIAVDNNNYIKESARLVQELTEAKIKEKYVKALEETNAQLDQKNKELNQLFKELQQKEGQLIHSEKMASLGHLVAGISHELNNPISFIYANTKALETYLVELQTLWASLKLDSSNAEQKKFASITQDLQEIIQDNLTGSKSVKELVLNLKNFSRLDQAEWKEAHLISGIDSSLKILKPQITDQIHIIKDYQADPPIFCNPGQLNQVFLNLLSNALQAIGQVGKITITTKTDSDWFMVEVADTGCGIPKDIQKKIFDPFFTTKDVNVGNGLGLSISYTIIQSHGGKITVQSEPGEGSVFTIFLPLKMNNVAHSKNK